MAWPRNDGLDEVSVTGMAQRTHGVLAHMVFHIGILSRYASGAASVNCSAASRKKGGGGLVRASAMAAKLVKARRPLEAEALPR